MTLSIVFAIICCVYLIYALIAAYISTGIRGRYERRQDLPQVSIVIPARNEEGVIGMMLESLLRLDYPPELLQIVVANDQSTDRTLEEASAYNDRFPCRFEIHEVKDEPETNLRLKTRALCQGLDYATGEIILMTDADCVIPANWARSMASFFAPGVGMVCGTTIPHNSPDAHYPLTWFETLDWLFLLGSSAGLAGLGQPRGLIGNNFSVRRSTYQKLGTFRAIEDTDPYDDLSLMNAVVRVGEKVVYPADKGLTLFTKPIESLYQLARQRRRWMTGMRETGWSGKLVIGFSFLAHICLILWALTVGWWALVPYVLLMLGNALIICPMLFRFGKGRLVGLVPFYPVFTMVYSVLVAYVFVRGGEFVWRGRQL